ncbi:DUF2156 domain-containing protein [Enterocloster hominis (ex Hitch et al. 2024)]|uniref:Phosphatidylglycerol lysyltransferase domain-containing protein n=1 Tax=Enterocloster hominis (ex Hitch et al. 2024) TaxID=1917870 RepID=A0ABV1D7T2_9FIRM
MDKTCNKKQTGPCTGSCCAQTCSYQVSGNTALSMDWGGNAPSIIRSTPIEFRELSIADRSWMVPILAAEDSLASDGCFGTFFLWGRAYGMTAADLGSRMIARYQTEDGLFFSYPAGSGTLKPAITQMKRLAEQLGQPLLIKGVTEAQKQCLLAEFPTQFRFEGLRDSADYIYEAGTLASLGGKKLHNKRNHCNRFEQECLDWHFEVLGQEHIDSCLALLQSWEENHEGLESGMPEAEKEAILTAFKHYDALGLTGGVLYARDRLLAFTFGEPVGGHGFDVRFEKADITVHGTYQMINREFVRHLLKVYPELHYINREEDMGMENLRKAKESYYPAFMLDKYAARWE